MSRTPGDNDELSVDEAVMWAEIASWTVIVLCPFLYLINGRAVSTDQLVMRIILVSCATATAVALQVRRRIMASPRSSEHSKE